MALFPELSSVPQWDSRPIQQRQNRSLARAEAASTACPLSPGLTVTTAHSVWTLSSDDSTYRLPGLSSEASLEQEIMTCEYNPKPRANKQHLKAQLWGAPLGTAGGILLPRWALVVERSGFRVKSPVRLKKKKPGSPSATNCR